MTVNSLEVIDVSEFIEQGQLPARVFKREGGEKWHVLDTPPQYNSPVPASSWVLVMKGEYVRVPLIPFILPETDPLNVFASALGLLGQLFAEERNAARKHWVLGAPAETLEKGCRIWLGVAKLLQ